MRDLRQELKTNGFVDINPEEGVIYQKILNELKVSNDVMESRSPEGVYRLISRISVVMRNVKNPDGETYGDVYVAFPGISITELAQKNYARYQYKFFFFTYEELEANFPVEHESNDLWNQTWFFFEDSFEQAVEKVDIYAEN